MVTIKYQSENNTEPGQEYGVTFRYPNAKKLLRCRINSPFVLVSLRAFPTSLNETNVHIVTENRGKTWKKVQVWLTFEDD